MLPIRISVYIKFHFEQAISNFRPNLHKIDTYGQKQKKWTSSLNLVYSN